MVMRVGRKTFSRLREFFGDAGGAITVEFVVTLPILLAALGFAAQYGEAMQTRNSLDVAARDAARLISRAPLDDTGTTVHPDFLCAAREIITARLGDSVSLFDSSADGLTSLGCTGFYTDASNGIAMDGDGAPITDSISIVATATETTITIDAFAEFTFAQFFQFRENDAEFTTENGTTVYSYQALERKSYAEGIWMTAVEEWPRTQ